MISMERNIGSKKQSGEAPGAVPLRGTPVRALQSGGLPGACSMQLLLNGLCKERKHSPAETKKKEGVSAPATLPCGPGNPGHCSG